MNRQDFDHRQALYTKSLRELGLSEEEIARIHAQDLHEFLEVNAGRCPKCGRAIRRTIARQGGPVNPELGPGGWVSYRCSTQPPIGKVRLKGTCDYMLDRWEPGGAN